MCCDNDITLNLKVFRFTNQVFYWYFQTIRINFKYYQIIFSVLFYVWIFIFTVCFTKENILKIYLKANRIMHERKKEQWLKKKQKFKAQCHDVWLNVGAKMIFQFISFEVLQHCNINIILRDLQCLIGCHRS